MPHFEPLDRRLHGRLGEMLAEDHLAIQAAIDLVIRIANRQSGEITAGFRKGLVSLNLDHRLLGAPTAEGAKQNDGSKSCFFIFLFFVDYDLLILSFSRHVGRSRPTARELPLRRSAVHI